MGRKGGRGKHQDAAAEAINKNYCQDQFDRKDQKIKIENDLRVALGLSIAKNTVLIKMHTCIAVSRIK
ncbi:hypothetical protein FACS189485_21650 [Spirochaetia bacterium]|nr:hypothetical protein FACS189485_21650 [Spirochaetia bacterium]